MFVQRIVLADHLIDDLLHLSEFLVGNLLEVRNIEAKGIRADIRSLLFGMLARTCFSA